ncbi:MAG TPA: molybdopterin-dependent oxidoreductase, partial [Verrucomicrobiae bacterium]|nr:molybdopterin-dependent oxidoreductase [Verrucomicrobiae bacterium]
EIWAAKLMEAKTNFGSQSVLHHFDYGSNGLLRNLDRRFFNVFGGVTVPSGSLCWGSGIAAQQYDFGGYYTHSWADLVNARTIILWGRDPVVTNLHLLPFLKEAKEQGARIVVINPVRVKSADLADTYLSPRPGTDGALALGMAHEILNQRLMDLNFIQNHVQGFAEYAEMVKDFPPEKVEEITGISAGEICELARTYAKQRPAAILCGYGMQRYANGGQTVRAINALGAITGNIALPGGGVNYAHQYNKGLFHDLTLPEAASNYREIPFPLLGTRIPELTDPPIRVAVVTRSNPVLQHPDTTTFIAAFRGIDFKVTIDFHLTDTAEESDLFLPCTTIFEEEDLIATSWNEYIGYAPKIIEPRGEAKPDPVIFSELAGHLGLGEFFAKSPREFIEEALRGKSDLIVEKLNSGPMKTPFAQDVAWADKKFLTPSGKVELYSVAAAAATGEGTARYSPPRESGTAVGEGYPLYFLTPHPAKALHSQFNSGEDNYPWLEIHPETAGAYNLREGNLVTVESPRGQLVCRAKLNDRLREDTVQVIEGQWLKFGGGVNLLTPGFLPDMGDSVPYYDCRCQL